MNTLSDYVEQVRIWTEETPAAGKPDEASREEIVEHIAESIRQTAAAGSHFSRMLTPGEAAKELPVQLPLHKDRQEAPPSVRHRLQ